MSFQSDESGVQGTEPYRFDLYGQADVRWGSAYSSSTDTCRSLRRLSPLELIVSNLAISESRQELRPHLQST